MSDEQKLRTDENTVENKLAQFEKMLTDMRGLLAGDPPRKSDDPQAPPAKDGSDGTDDKDWPEMSPEEREKAFQRHLREDPESKARTFEAYTQKRDDAEVLKGVAEVGSGLLLSGEAEDDTTFVDPEFQRHGRM